MNYCTVSYTAAWWNWERWQQELDYMAMNAINMPLFSVGLDGVWYNTLLRFHGRRSPGFSHWTGTFGMAVDAEYSELWWSFA